MLCSKDIAIKRSFIPSCFSLCFWPILTGWISCDRRRVSNTERSWCATRSVLVVYRIPASFSAKVTYLSDKGNHRFYNVGFNVGLRSLRGDLRNVQPRRAFFSFFFCMCLCHQPDVMVHPSKTTINFDLLARSPGIPGIQRTNSSIPHLQRHQLRPSLSESKSRVPAEETVLTYSTGMMKWFSVEDPRVVAYWGGGLLCDWSRRNLTLLLATNLCMWSDVWKNRAPTVRFCADAILHTNNAGVLPTRLLAAWGDDQIISYHASNFAKAEVIMFGGVEYSNSDPLLDVISDPNVSFFDVTAVSPACISALL